MSRLKLKPENKIERASLLVTDDNMCSSAEIWAYSDAIYFRVGTEIVSLNFKQLEKVNEFIERQRKK